MIFQPVISGGSGAKPETVTVTFPNNTYNGSWCLADGTVLDFSMQKETNRTISVPKGQLLALRISDPNGPIIRTNGSVGIEFTAYQSMFAPINTIGIFTPLSDLTLDLDD